MNLTVNNLPFGSGPRHVRQYVLDHTHANAYTTWVGQGSPAKPTATQWSALSASAELCYYDTMVTPTGNSWSVMFPQNNYSVSLLVISRWIVPTGWARPAVESGAGATRCDNHWIERLEGAFLRSPMNQPAAREVTVPETLAGERLDRAIAALAPEVSRGEARRLIAAGVVFVDGKRTGIQSRLVRAGERLSWSRSPIAPAERTDGGVDPRIVVERPDLLIVDKPAGMPF